MYLQSNWQFVTLLCIGFENLIILLVFDSWHFRSYFCPYVIGAFEDPDIIHVDDSVDPVRDLEVIGNELRLKVCVQI